MPHEVRHLLVACVDQYAVTAGGVGDDVRDAALDGLRGNAVLFIIGALLLAPPLGFGHRAFHAARDPVGVEDYASVYISRRTPDGLDQGGLAPQETFLVRIEDADQPAFGNVEPFAQEIDADQHVVNAESQVADQLNPFQRLHV